MTSKELALALSNSHKDVPGDFELFKTEVTAAYEKFIAPRRRLGDELMESEDKFCSTLGEILDMNIDSGILEPIDHIIFTKVLKAISKVTGLYNRIKK